jgi:hypothetical protein
MSSGVGEWVLLGVGEEGAVDDVGEFAFEESKGFSFGGAGLETALDEGLGVGVDTDLGDRDAVQRGVGLPVPSPVESAFCQSRLTTGRCVGGGGHLRGRADRQWPGLRAIRRLNVPKITKERSA